MKAQSTEALLAWQAMHFPLFNSSTSSRTASPTDSQSEQTSSNEHSTTDSESPPPEAIEDTVCNGFSGNCLYGENDQPHCHLKCSPRSCKQCREVTDKEWIQEGRWLEDCISWDEDDEQRHKEKDLSGRQGVTKVIAFGGLAVLMAGIFYWMCPYRRVLEII